MLIKTRTSGAEKNACVICTNKQCVDEKQIIVRYVDPETTYSGRITRNMSKIIKLMNEFVIYEVYRCMPLLGDEKINVPDWDIHIVHYAVVFSGK